MLCNCNILAGLDLPRKSYSYIFVLLFSLLRTTDIANVKSIRHGLKSTKTAMLLASVIDADLQNWHVFAKKERLTCITLTELYFFFFIQFYLYWLGLMDHSSFQNHPTLHS